jgi:hypothetical protein
MSAELQVKWLLVVLHGPRLNLVLKRILLRAYLSWQEDYVFVLVKNSIVNFGPWFKYLFKAEVIVALLKGFKIDVAVLLFEGLDRGARRDLGQH